MFKVTNLMKAVVIFVGLVVITFCIMLTPEFFRETTLIATRIKEDVPLLGIVNYWFIASLYLILIPFVMMLIKTLKLICLIEKKSTFSNQTIQILKQIRNNAIIICMGYMIGIMPLIYSVAELDDAPGLIIIGFVIGLAPFIIAMVVAILQKVLKEAIEYKSDSDLTV